MKTSAEALYRLDDDDQANVVRHLQKCGDCKLSASFFQHTRTGDRIVKANDLCMELRADLEREGREPENGFELRFNQEGEANRHIHTLRREASRYTWLLQEIQESLPVDTPPCHFLLIPSYGFLTGALERFLMAESPNLG